MFGIGRSIKKVGGKGLSLGLVGPAGALFGGALDLASGRKIPAADRAALKEATRLEAERKTRLLEQQQRRSRVALGSIGGIRQLAYGTLRTLGPPAATTTTTTGTGARRAGRPEDLAMLASPGSRRELA